MTPLTVYDVRLAPRCRDNPHGEQVVILPDEEEFTIPGPEPDVLVAALAGYNAGHAHGAAEGRQAVKDSVFQLFGIPANLARRLENLEIAAAEQRYASRAQELETGGAR